MSFLFTGVDLCIIQIVFVVTARMTACRDLTNNEADVKRIRELFLILRTTYLSDHSVSPATRSILGLPLEATQGVATLRLESDKRKNNALWEFVKAKANLTALPISVYI